jgi:hypothetical protein
MSDSKGQSPFDGFFRRAGSDQRRAKFLSRLFGLFSEELVRIWTNDGRAPYSDLGRSTIYDPKLPRPATLDFTFEERRTGSAFVVEMKCEIEFQNFKFLTLSSPMQFKHHSKPAFTAFLNAAKIDAQQAVKVRGRPQQTQGAILIWGSVSPEGRQSCIARYGFHDIIGIDQIIDDLIRWDSPDFAAFIDRIEGWSSELFSFLKPRGVLPMTVKVFKKDDEGFKKWRDDNPDGSILNAPYPAAGDLRKYNLRHLKLHSATCPVLQPDKNGEKPWTTSGYFKVCANQADDITMWVDRNVDKSSGWELPRCKRSTCQ